MPEQVRSRCKNANSVATSICQAAIHWTQIPQVNDDLESVARGESANSERGGRRFGNDREPSTCWRRALALISSKLNRRTDEFRYVTLGVISVRFPPFSRACLFTVRLRETG